MRVVSTLLLTLALACGAAAVAQDELPAPGAPGAASSPGADQAQAEAQFKQKVGYCIGLDLGRRLKADGVQLDIRAIAAGLADGVSGAEPKLTDEQITAVMSRFQQIMQQKAESQMADAATENLNRGKAFLEENAKKDGIQTTESGLQYRVVEEGEGGSPGPRDTVRCHYEGTLTSGEVFDSSYKRGQPAEFPVGGVIAGWTEALQMMKVGAKWEVFLPPNIAYGMRGAPGAIGPNETLVFTIELLDIVD